MASGASVHRRRYDKLLTNAWMKNMEIMPEVFFILPRNLTLYRCVTVNVVAVISLLFRLSVGENYGGKMMIRRKLEFLINRKASLKTNS